ncbi:MAG: hypothetical protein IID45_11220 [Planctomycetes bacterium]|nr:hypothetical protein [Planctomycetota bacterium]
MPTVTAESTSFAKPWDVLKTTLAASARFQTLAGVGDADAAKAFIKFFWDTSPLSAVRCMIRGLDEDLFEVFALGAFRRQALDRYSENMRPSKTPSRMSPTTLLYSLFGSVET